jgi:hypothetical protein
MPVFFDPKTGERFENDAPDAAERAGQFGLIPAEQYERERALANRGVFEKADEVVQTYGEGLQQISRELGKFRLDDTGLAQSLFPGQAGAVSGAVAAHQQKTDAALADPAVAERAARHPIAHALGVDTPALFVGGGIVGKGAGLLVKAGGLAAESAAVGLSDEAVASTEEGREFDPARAAGGGAEDLAFSAAEIGRAHV